MGACVCECECMCACVCVCARVCVSMHNPKPGYLHECIVTDTLCVLIRFCTKVILTKCSFILIVTTLRINYLLSAAQCWQTAATEERDKS